jgi:hypothetical protein
MRTRSAKLSRIYGAYRSTLLGVTFGSHCISTETVRQHTVNLFRKLNVGNRRQAIVAAHSQGYISAPAARGGFTK